VFCNGAYEAEDGDLRAARSRPDPRRHARSAEKGRASPSLVPLTRLLTVCVTEVSATEVL